MSNVDLNNGNILAYIGDGVMTLTVRQFLVEQGFTKAKELQEKSTFYISAKAQAAVVSVLLEEGFFNEKEETVYRLGRNYKGHSIAKNADVQTYKMASGFEAVWGYWHLNNNPQRLKEIWDKTRTIVEESLC